MNEKALKSFEFVRSSGTGTLFFDGCYVCVNAGKVGQFVVVTEFFGDGAGMHRDSDASPFAKCDGYESGF